MIWALLFSFVSSLFTTVYLINLYFVLLSEYLEENENFDISERLKVLFPLVDTNPSDGFITEQELKLWLVNQAKKMSLHRTDRELEITDKNKDGFVSLKEYLHDDSAGDDCKFQLNHIDFSKKNKILTVFFFFGSLQYIWKSLTICLTGGTKQRNNSHWQILMGMGSWIKLNLMSTV